MENSSIFRNSSLNEFTADGASCLAYVEVLPKQVI
jgi:hypothetical protein